MICLNGPPARHFQPGDKVIIIGEAYVEPSEIKKREPAIVFVNDRNKVIRFKGRCRAVSRRGAQAT